MNFVDTHTHLYLPDFSSDIEVVISNAIDTGVKHLMLPNIDVKSVEPMMKLVDKHPENCFPMFGLHPSSVKLNFNDELSVIESGIKNRCCCAVGETGIDLYWDSTYIREQEDVFRVHIEWALQYDLPLVIHSRNSFNDIISILKDYPAGNLRGVFHCFPGSVEQAKDAIRMNFLLGIGGVVTFKNAKLVKVVESVDIKHLLLETDSPYLAPEPYRGKRNESKYIPVIAGKIAEIKQITLEDVAEGTTDNALKLFKTK